MRIAMGLGAIFLVIGLSTFSLAQPGHEEPKGVAKGMGHPVAPPGVAKGAGPTCEERAARAGQLLGVTMRAELARVREQLVADLQRAPMGVGARNQLEAATTQRIDELEQVLMVRVLSTIRAIRGGN